MKKVGVIVSLLCMALLAQAQGRLLHVAHMDIGRVWERLSLGLPMQRALARQMRPYRFKLSKPAFRQPMASALKNFSAEQQAQILAKHTRVLQETQTLAKALDTKIFYQGTPEGRLMPPAEIASDQREILTALNNVRAVQVFFETPDEALAQAEEYLARVSHFYQMCATGVIEPLEEATETIQKKEPRPFERERFFLLNSAGTEDVANFPLPQKLRVAIITDYGIGEDFKRMAENENLSLWRFDIYRNPEQFLNRPDHLAYDLVLTDVLISHGGGMYLARQLRHDKFKGAIIAVTAFPEQDLIGIKLRDAGMDGMIMLSDIDPYLILERPTMFAQKLRNYFYYKTQVSPVEKIVAQPLP